MSCLGTYFLILFILFSLFAMNFYFSEMKKVKYFPPILVELQIDKYIT